WDMVMIERQIQLLGGPSTGVDLPGGPIEKCLRFQLDFDSSILDSGSGTSLNRHVAASIPLRMESKSATEVAWIGGGELKWTSIDATLPNSLCRATFQTQSGFFDVESASRFARVLPFQLRPTFFDPFPDPPGRPPLPMVVLHDPGQP